MTIPWMMNCAHSDNGWCLKCVKELANERNKYEEALKRIIKGPYAGDFSSAVEVAAEVLAEYNQLPIQIEKIDETREKFHRMLNFAMDETKEGDFFLPQFVRIIMLDMCNSSKG